MAGYSGTPLAAKLGIKSGTRILLIGAPEDYISLLTPLPEAVSFVSDLADSPDVIHLFTRQLSELKTVVRSCRSQMPVSAALWVSWPKKSSKAPTDISEDAIRAVALPLGLVDIKVCAVDDVWSGLKLVIRRELR